MHDSFEGLLVENEHNKNIVLIKYIGEVAFDVQYYQLRLDNKIISIVTSITNYAIGQIIYSVTTDIQYIAGYLLRDMALGLNDASRQQYQTTAVKIMADINSEVAEDEWLFTDYSGFEELGSNDEAYIDNIHYSSDLVDHISSRITRTNYVLDWISELPLDMKHKCMDHWYVSFDYTTTWYQSDEDAGLRFKRLEKADKKELFQLKAPAFKEYGAKSTSRYVSDAELQQYARNSIYRYKKWQ